MIGRTISHYRIGKKRRFGQCGRGGGVASWVRTGKGWGLAVRERG